MDYSLERLMEHHWDLHLADPMDSLMDEMSGVARVFLLALTKELSTDVPKDYLMALL